MVKSRKKFDREFKLMAVELIETHKTVAEVAKVGVLCVLSNTTKWYFLKEANYGSCLHKTFEFPEQWNKSNAGFLESG